MGLMDEDLEDQFGPGRRERLVESLDRMVDSGRATEAEASQLRAAAGPAQFERAVRNIRVRHAGTQLTAAVEDGKMTQDEADAYVERLKNGEHPKGLRAHLRKLVPRAR